jgi:hypothetical protein
MESLGFFYSLLILESYWVKRKGSSGGPDIRTYKGPSLHTYIELNEISCRMSDVRNSIDKLFQYHYLENLLSGKFRRAFGSQLGINKQVLIDLDVCPSVKNC